MREVPGTYFIQFGKVKSLRSLFKLDLTYLNSNYNDYYIYEIGFTLDIFKTLTMYDNNKKYKDYKLLFFNYVPVHEFKNIKTLILENELIQNKINSKENGNHQSIIILKKSDTRAVKDIYNTIQFQKN